MAEEWSSAAGAGRRGRRGLNRRKGSRVALLVEGLETFRSVRYAVSHCGGGCHDFRALIKEIKERLGGEGSR